jgi:chaperonin GroEL
MNKVIKIDQAYLDCVRKVVDLVGSTAGPYGANVHLFDGTAPVTFRDGMKVLEHYQPVQDDMMNNVVTRIRQRAMGVRRAAGDATTTFTILLGALYEIGLGLEEGSLRGKGNQVRNFAKGVLAELDKMAIPVGNDAAGFDLLAKVATLAGNNDPVIGELVAKLVFEIGRDGTIDLEFDDSISGLQAKRLDGFLLKGGPWHESFIGGKFGKSSIENPYVLILDEAKEWKDVVPMIQAWVAEYEKDQRPLVVVALNLEGSALGTLVKRVRAGGGPVMPVYCVKAASNEVLGDLRSVVGGKSLVKQDGSMLADFKGVQDFGEAAKVIVDLKGAVFVGKEGVGDLEGRKGALEVLMAAAEGDEQREKIKARIANMEQRVGVIKIPIVTTGSTNWLKEVVEDAYMASFAALKEGVLPGAGLSIARAGWEVGKEKFKAASVAVFSQLLRNGGIPETDIAEAVAWGIADTYEVLLLDDECLQQLLSDGAGKWGDAVELGVLDSLSAVKAAVYNAAEEAAEWIETKFVVLPNF